MTQAQKNHAALVAKASQLSIGALKEKISIYMIEDSTEGQLLCDAMVDALQSKIPENEFIAFCDAQ